MTQRGRADRWLPILAWAFVGAAALQLALWASVNWYRIFGPYLILRLDDLSSIVTGMAPFLLGAAVLVGAARWPEGRRWLIAGAVLSALSGVAQTATEAWWLWRMTDPIAPEGLVQVWLIAGRLVLVTAAALAALCLAAGLARVRPARPASRSALLVPVAVGAVVVAGGLGLLARELGAASEIPDEQAAFVVLGIVHRLLATLGALGLAALAAAAVRAMPVAGVLPEVLIAAGATLAAVGSAATWIGQALLSFEEQSQQLLWVFTTPFAATAVGLVLIIAGFGLAALTGRRGTIGRHGDRGSGTSEHRADP
jgi:hypothetical protein